MGELEIDVGLRAFLGDLDAAAREQLLARMRERRFKRDERLLHQGALGDAVLLLRAGTVKIVALQNGHRAVIALRGPGDIVGELATIDGAPRTAEVVAVQDGVAVEIEGAAFRKALEAAPRARRQVDALLARRLRESTSRMIESGVLDVTGRMASRVLELAERFGQLQPNGTITFDPPLSRAELASWAGGSREAGARAMGALRAAGWIETRGRTIVVLDRAALQRRTAG
jgi:CRP/FNR family cyclic AMP-dependent transcriptional regulator